MPPSGYPAPGYPAPGYPASGYPAPGAPIAYGYPMVAQRTNGLAMASMVLSIIGAALLMCYGSGALPALVGAILGHVARGRIGATARTAPARRWPASSSDGSWSA